MNLFRKKNKLPHTPLVQASIEGHLALSFNEREKGLKFLVDFFKEIRPSRIALPGTAEQKLQSAIALLHEQPNLLKDLQTALFAQIINTNLVPAFTESGLLHSRGFIQELFKRINYKFLPPLQDKNDFLHVINQVFYKKTDFLWVEAIERKTWKDFFHTIALPVTLQNRTLQRQLLKSLSILSYRLSNYGLEPELVSILSSDFSTNNPFIGQNILLKQLSEYINADEPCAEEQTVIKDFEKSLQSVTGYIEQVRTLQSEKGASLSLSYLILLIDFCIGRMRLLLGGLDDNHEYRTNNLVDFFRVLVRNESRKTSIRELMSNSLGYVAYQIAEHKGAKGEKYITVSRKDYYKMIGSAMWGGLIICFVAVFKTLLGFVGFPPFWKGVAYSVNYSAGFVAIEETHSILATKQPAFTASAIASSLDIRKSEQPNLYSLAITVARTTRSQIASFFGNLIIVFPVTYMLAWGYDKVFHHKLVEGAAAISMLDSQHPWYSLSWLYACNTGIFLFISGLIAGFVQNKVRYGRVGERIETHPLLKNTFLQKRLHRLAHYITQHSGALAGNISLGFFLGMSTVVHKIFGFPFDIRHITISAANTSIGIYGAGFHNLTWPYMLEVLIGVLGIGFFNFAVSFALAFFVAVKSRGIRLKEYPEFISILFRYFKKHPLSFIFPPKKLIVRE